MQFRDVSEVFLWRGIFQILRGSFSLFRSELNWEALWVRGCALLSEGVDPRDLQVRSATAL